MEPDEVTVAISSCRRFWVKFLCVHTYTPYTPLLNLYPPTVPYFRLRNLDWFNNLTCSPRHAARDLICHKLKICWSIDPWLGWNIVTLGSKATLLIAEPTPFVLFTSGVQRTKLCHSDLLANDAMHRFSAPRPFLLLLCVPILRHCNAL
ncbi:hypothetical protein EVAR_75635_1 [Eumeta japonica]|uniref:Uncharacterized protein n=1 Tax=Eumeta variegata TaxID=151549 RepID=A0A4C1U001_EUMVA|nr:hypothetical protein EVAR_75635_1 [Eumeta japonica]